jgi:hypothetical protein
VKAILQRSHSDGQMDMIGSDDANEVNRIWALALSLDHFLVVCVGPVRAYVIRFASLARAHRVLTECSSYQFDVTIQLRCHAMNRPDKRTRTAPNHPHPKTSAWLRHPHLS